MNMITKKLLDDVLKVVVDHTSDPNAYVGDFELIHSQEIYETSNASNLTIVGKKWDRKFNRSQFQETMMKIKENNGTFPMMERNVEYEANDGTKYIYLKEKA